MTKHLIFIIIFKFTSNLVSSYNVSESDTVTPDSSFCVILCQHALQPFIISSVDIVIYCLLMFLNIGHFTKKSPCERGFGFTSPDNLRCNRAFKNDICLITY